MMKKTIYIIGIISWMILSSCNALDDFNETAMMKVPIVVEGILMPDMQPVVWISKLSETENINDTSYIPVNNAKVTLYYNDKPYELSLYDSEWGEYCYSDTDLIIREGEYYYLEVEYEDRIVSSETSIPYAVRNISVSVEQASTQDSSYILNVKWDTIDDSYFYFFLGGDITNTNESPCFYSEYPFAENSYSINADSLTEGNTYYVYIYSLTRNYAQYYFGYDPLNSNYVYESNIEDAYGIFTGLSISGISLFTAKILI